MRRGAIGNLGGVVIALVVTMVLIFVGTMLGGIFHATMSDTFSDLSVSSDWTNLASNAASYSQTGIRLVSIGIIIVAISAILAIVLGFGGGLFGGGKGQ